MRKRFLAFALTFGLLLSACGGTAAETPEPTATPTPAPTAAPAATQGQTPVLEMGWYRLLTEQDEVGGFLHVTRNTLITYRPDGTLSERQDYRYDESAGGYLVGQSGALGLLQDRQGLWMTDWNGKGPFLLEEVDKSAVPEAPAEESAQAGQALAGEALYAMVLPSTVDITATIGGISYEGTGFFIDTRGTLITNYHVVEGTTEAYVTTSAGEDYQVTRVLGYDPLLDIAVLETDCPASTPLARRSTPAVTGERVYALGSSGGLVGTFSDGQVSTAAREYDGQTYIQHTAPISHGNSGGPLLDKAGQVIGINAAYIDDGQNLNLAIPITMVDRVDLSSPMTLEQVYQQERGYDPDYGEVDEDDWISAWLAVDDDVGVRMSLPEEFYDALEVNETETGLAGFYETDDILIYLEADADAGDYPDLESWTDQEMDQFLALMEEAFEGADSFTSEQVTLNEKDWLILEGSFTEEDLTYSDLYLFTVKDGVLLTANFTYTGATEDDQWIAEYLVLAMITTMEVD